MSLGVCHADHGEWQKDGCQHGSGDERVHCVSPVWCAVCPPLYSVIGCGQPRHPPIPVFYENSRKSLRGNGLGSLPHYIEVKPSTMGPQSVLRLSLKVKLPPLKPQSVFGKIGRVGYFVWIDKKDNKGEIAWVVQAKLTRFVSKSIS